MRFLPMLRVTVALLWASTAMGCASFTPSVHEPMRIGTTDDLSPGALGFHHGSTTLDAAREQLRARGMTGMAEDAFVTPGGPVLAVLGADYQSRVHVFRDGRYDHTIDLPTAGALPYGLVLRLGSDDASTMLLVIYRDPLGRRTQPPELLSYRWLDGAPAETGDAAADLYEPAPIDARFELAQRTSLAEMAERHQGMTRPILVGATFSEGALLFARDSHGRIWDKGYLVRSKAGALVLDAMPWSKAMKCSCVQSYSFADL